MQTRWHPGRNTLAILVCVGLAACARNAPVVVRAAGSSTVYKSIIEPVAASLEKFEGIRVAPDIQGTGAGFIALLQGQAEVLLSSSELPTVVDSARALGWQGGDEALAGLYVARLHEERIVVVVNSSNPVRSLSTEQLVQVMSGEIANWSQVGGKDLPIMVVLPEPGRATREVFAKAVMKGVPFAKTAFDQQATGKTDDVVRVNASAIAVTGETFFYPGHLKILDTAKVTRPLLLITRGLPAGPVQRLIEHVNGLGRRDWQLQRTDLFWTGVD